MACSASPHHSYSDHIILHLKLDDSRESNIEYNGHGEIGSIMLDFQWNSMMQSKGYGELAKPMYDQRMWDDRGSALKAPTVRAL